MRLALLPPELLGLDYSLILPWHQLVDTADGMALDAAQRDGTHGAFCDDGPITDSFKVDMEHSAVVDFGRSLRADDEAVLAHRSEIPNRTFSD